MAAKYRKIDPRIWRDEKFRQLDDRGKLVVLELLTGQSNRCGLFYFSPALAAEDLGWTAETWLEVAKAACAAMEWPFDEPSRCVLIPKWWRYNDPQTARILTDCLKDLEDLPKTTLSERYQETAQHLRRNLRAHFFRTWRNPHLPPPYKPPLSQEQEQEQEKEDEEPPYPRRRRGKSVSLRAEKKNPRAQGTNPRAIAEQAKAAEEKRRSRLISKLRFAGDRTLADGTELQSIGIRERGSGIVTWNRIKTERLEDLAKELGKEISS